MVVRSSLNNRFVLSIALIFALCCRTSLAPAEDVAASPDVKVGATRSDDGILVHEVQSPYQAGTTLIRVLLPSPMSPERRYPVVYVLPVEDHQGKQYGDGLAEIRQRELHKKYAAIFVAPTFSHTPWFADHASDPAIRQETYFVQVVVPSVDKAYPVLAEPKGRLLLGFSKSGWGAWSLLLRHPELFGRAAAWDSPLLMSGIDKFGTRAIFCTQENFEKYRLTEALRAQANTLREQKRLILMGFTRSTHPQAQTHALLEELKIPHDYRDGQPREHDWHSGWVPDAVELLLKN